MLWVYTDFVFFCFFYPYIISVHAVVQFQLILIIHSFIYLFWVQACLLYCSSLCPPAWCFLCSALEIGFTTRPVSHWAPQPVWQPHPASSSGTHINQFKQTDCRYWCLICWPEIATDDCWELSWVMQKLFVFVLCWMLFYIFSFILATFKSPPRL